MLSLDSKLAELRSGDGNMTNRCTICGLGTVRLVYFKISSHKKVALIEPRSFKNFATATRTNPSALSHFKACIIYIGDVSDTQPTVVRNYS
jgi:hypothetical protein